MKNTVESGTGGIFPCTTPNSHVIIKWRSCGFVILLLLVEICACMSIPYIISMVMKRMPAFLPFISRAGGLPPQSGIFAICLIFLGLTVLIAIPLFHETINHRNVENSKKIRVANNIAVYFLLMCSIGSVITAAFPIGYTDVASKFDWAFFVLLEHGFGTSLGFSTVIIYQFLLTWVWWFLKDTGKCKKCIQIGICAIYVMLFFTCIKPLLTYLYEELGPEPFNIEMLKSTTYQLPSVFSTSYIVSSFCEWTLCIFILVHFSTFYKDFQRVSCRIVLRPKTSAVRCTEVPALISLETFSS